MSEVPIEFRISKRAQRLRIDVTAREGVVVVVPRGTPQAEVDRFVASRQAWIGRARNRVAAHAAAHAAPDPAFVPEQLALRALDRTLTVDSIEAAQRRIRRVGDRLRLEGMASPADSRDALAQWLKRETRRRLVPRLETLARQNALVYERAAVRGQRTRWASCSGRGTISLNFRLLFLPADLVDHVLLHELAHTRHLNHSQRFWRLLARLDPDWRGHHARLRDARQWVPAWVEMA